MKKIIIACLFSLASVSAGEISIAVSANVSYAIESLKKEFKLEHPETHIQVILGSSGKLTAQIKHGAPYDLLLSANMKYPDALYKEKMAVTKPVRGHWLCFLSKNVITAQRCMYLNHLMSKK